MLALVVGGTRDLTPAGTRFLTPLATAGGIKQASPAGGRRGRAARRELSEVQRGVESISPVF